MSTSKASPIKRPPQPHDDYAIRPFKKLNIENIERTGLELDSIIEEITPRATSPITTSEITSYSRRRKVISYAEKIRRKKAMRAKVNADWSGMSVSAQGGLDNFTGAICYRLSLLQVLLHLPKFVHLLRDFHRPEDCVSDDKEKCVTCCLRLLAQEYWRGSQSPIGTLKVLRVLNDVFKSAGWVPDVSYGHADPDEQFSWLFSIMQAELPSSISLCLEAILQPVLVSAVICARCGHESKTSGHEMGSLPLPLAPAIKPTGTLAAYLRRFMTEKVQDYRCDNCKDNTTTKERKQLINYAPDIISFQLKRTDNFGRKPNTVVAINPSIDLSSYLEAGHAPLHYELTAIIKHKGTPQSGHYIAFSKGPDGEWYGFDDSRKAKTSFATAISSSTGFTPYILYFRRKED